MDGENIPHFWILQNQMPLALETINHPSRIFCQSELKRKTQSVKKGPMCMF